MSIVETSLFEIIGRNISIKRQQLGMTLEELCSLSGLRSVSHLCAVENGRAKLSVEKLYLISLVLDMPLGPLFEEEIIL